MKDEVVVYTVMVNGTDYYVNTVYDFDNSPTFYFTTDIRNAYFWKNRSGSMAKRKEILKAKKEGFTDKGAIKRVTLGKVKLEKLT